MAEFEAGRKAPSQKATPKGYFETIAGTKRAIYIEDFKKKLLGNAEHLGTMFFLIRGRYK